MRGCEEEKGVLGQLMKHIVIVGFGSLVPNEGGWVMLFPIDSFGF